MNIRIIAWIRAQFAVFTAIVTALVASITGALVAASGLAALVPATAFAADPPESESRASVSQARSLANEPSLMEKAKMRAHNRVVQIKHTAPNAKSANALLRWAARVTSRELPAGLQAPPLVGLSEKELHRRVCPVAPGQCESLIAAYGIKDRVILYNEALNMNNPVDRSYLLHELVHFLQHREEGPQVTTSCESILRWERHAYAAQSRYLAHSGHTFPIDEMMKLSYCPS
ncbi:MAG: hypothetical protein AB8C46_22360 [Burkholderiaceae bacterium]